MSTTPPLPGWMCRIRPERRQRDHWEEDWPTPDLHPLLVAADHEQAAFWRWYLPERELRSDDAILVALNGAADISGPERVWIVLDIHVDPEPWSWFDGEHGAADGLAPIRRFGDGARRFHARTTKEQLSDEHDIAALAYLRREDAWEDLAEYFPRVRQVLDLSRSPAEPISQSARALLEDDTSALVELADALEKAGDPSGASIRVWQREYLHATRLYAERMGLAFVDSAKALHHYACHHELPDSE